MKNKTSKYFKYAIGEITLVMVGILLALQVNNWNEKQKDNDLEQTFLIKLKSNLKDDVASYYQLNETHKMYIKHFDSALVILKNHRGYNAKDLQKHLKFLIYSSRFTTNKIAFNNLLSIGKMNIIKNDSLTDKLFLYYRKVQAVKESVSEGIDAYNRNTFGPTILEFDYLYESSTDGVKPLESYTNYPLITNSLELKKIMSNSLINNNNEQIENAESIVALIEKELEL